MNRIVFIFALSFLFSGCALMEREIDIEIDEVPTESMDAVMAAVPGFVVESAEIETSDGQTVYEIEGTVDGEEVEIEVAEDGTILEIEREEEEDEEEEEGEEKDKQ